MAEATLYDPATGKKVVVGKTPGDAATYFKQGYQLYTGQPTIGNPAPQTSLSTDFSRNIAQSLANSDQSTQFGTAIQDLLKQYQGVDKTPFVGQGMNAQNAQINRVQAQTSGDFATADPATQARVRAAQAGAIDPTIQGAQSAQSTFSGQLQSFGDILGQARQLQQQQEQAAQQSKADAKDFINNIFQNTNGDAFQKMDQRDIAGLEKLAGYPAGFISNMASVLRSQQEAAARAKQQEDELKFQRDVALKQTTSGGTRKSGGSGGLTANQQLARLSSYEKSFQSWGDKIDQGYTREDALASLQREFPEIDPETISKDVYTTYTDNWGERHNSGSLF